MPNPIPEPTHDEDTERLVTYCPDCQAQFGPDEEGYEWEECIECGGNSCFEIPG